MAVIQWRMLMMVHDTSVVSREDWENMIVMKDKRRGGKGGMGWGKGRCFDYYLWLGFWSRLDTCLAFTMGRSGRVVVLEVRTHLGVSANQARTGCRWATLTTRRPTGERGLSPTGTRHLSLATGKARDSYCRGWQRCGGGGFRDTIARPRCHWSC